MTTDKPKYLSIVIELGGQKFNFAAFKNEERTSNNQQPHYKGRNVGVWINDSKEKSQPEIDMR